ncbi:MAG: hypothetical protein JXR15_13075 [Shimia sp.]|uniref:hypothetical protein n=1 Tax=Shimia sp. TaxID=1954381 RepID=UPI003B8DF248
MDQDAKKIIQAETARKSIFRARQQIAHYAGSATAYRTDGKDHHVITCAGVSLTVDVQNVKSSNCILRQWQMQAASEGVFL